MRPPTYVAGTFNSIVILMMTTFMMMTRFEDVGVIVESCFELNCMDCVSYELQELRLILRK